MCVVLLLASVRGKQYDIINALSFSAILILVLNPFALFSVGFQLSVMAVLFIALLSKPLEKLFSKKMPRAVASALSATLAAQLGTLPIILKFYPEYSVLSILANLIVVPIASLGFEAVIVCLLIILVIPTAGLVLKVPEMIYFAVVKVSELVSHSAFLVGLSVDWVGYLTILTASSVASHFVFVNRRVKWFSVMVILVVILLSVGVMLAT